MVNIYKAKAKATVQGKVLNLTIDSADYEIQGIARYQNKIAFVAGALPTEQVQARVTEDKAGYIKAVTVKVLQPAPERSAAVCQFASRCGGCQLQHLAVTTQQQLKQQGVDSLIRHQTGLNTLPWQPMLSAQPDGYRRRARIGLWFDKKQRQLTVGFRQSGDKQITAISACMVLSPVLAPVFAALNQAVVALDDPACVTHAEVLDADGQAFVVVRHVKALSLQQQQRFINAWPDAIWLGEAEPGQFSYWQQTLAKPQYKLAGQGLTLEFAPDDFIQVNQGVNQMMIDQALQWLQVNSDDVVLDLYAGMGNFTLPLAQRAKTVRAVEGVAKMVQQLTTNAELNGLSNVVAYQADLHLPWPKAPWHQRDYTKVVLDPARAGAVGAVEQVVQLKPAQILYVSCNAATFARDAKVLLGGGYYLEKLAGIDMFPYTSHLEVMALFSRQ